MTAPLTPLEIIHDIHSLDRIERDWLIEGRLDGDTERYLHDKRADLMDDLRTRFTTGEAEAFDGDRWFAHEGDMDCDLVDGERYVPTIPVGYGATELDAIERLLEMTGEDV